MIINVALFDKLLTGTSLVYVNGGWTWKSWRREDIEEIGNYSPSTNDKSFYRSTSKLDHSKWSFDNFEFKTDLSSFHKFISNPQLSQMSRKSLFLHPHVNPFATIVTFLRQSRPSFDHHDCLMTFNKRLTIHFVRSSMVNQVNVSWKMMKIVMTVEDLIFTH